MRPLRAVFVAILLIGCTTFSDRENISSEEEGGIAFSVKKKRSSYTKTDDQCESNCSSVEIRFEKMEGNERFNQAIEKRIVKQLQDFVRDGERYKKLNRLTEAFIADYREFKEAFPESKTPWTINVDGKITFAVNKFISYRLTTNSYTGGAHTNTETLLFNVNQNGREIKIRSLITDRPKLMEVAENAFRKTKSLSATADLGAAGYTFDNNEFQLPENIGFTGKGVVLYYNDYEIASYADGPTEILIPYKELEGIVVLEKEK